MTERHSDDLVNAAIRPARAADRDAIVRLLARSMGDAWADDDRHREFFTWKHAQNPAGPSAAWVLADGDMIAGFRTFLRWELEDRDGPVSAVRAVDTATDPSQRRRGLFSRLTETALAELRAEGTGLVFNTPNDASRPGYLKLGWQTVGRPAVDVRPAGPTRLLGMARSRTAATKWSQPTDAGEDALDVLADVGAVASLLASQPAPRHLRTRRTPAFLQWRYGFAPLVYRAVLATGSTEDGFAIFRVRSRGPSTEAVVCDVVVPEGDRRLSDRLAARAARVAAADYALRLRPAAGRTRGFLPLPRSGPVLTALPLGRSSVPDVGGWDLTLGDIELF